LMSSIFLDGDATRMIRFCPFQPLWEPVEGAHP
jgi:hypothetical protein